MPIIRKSDQELKKAYPKIVFVIVLLAVIIMTFNSNTALQFFFKDKVWAHKVNTTERLKEAQQRFAGVELDAVFIPNNGNSFFDVNHPPDTSIGLSLTDYFKSEQEANSNKYWIDHKNLLEENAEESSRKLDSITKHLNLNKEDIIVESIRPGRLQRFKEKGFLTSYYMPLDLYLMDSIELKESLDQVKENVILFGNTYISANYKDYPILKKHFPEHKKIIWFTTYGSMGMLKARILLYTILLDKNVDVLLIPFEHEE